MTDLQILPQYYCGSNQVEVTIWQKRNSSSVFFNVLSIRKIQLILSWVVLYNKAKNIKQFFI